MNFPLKNLEIYINQNPGVTGLISNVSTNNSSFTVNYSSASNIIINSTIKIYPYQVTYWVKDYSSYPSNAYKFYQLHSYGGVNTNNSVIINNNTITINNITPLLTESANIGKTCQSGKCAQQRTIAKIIILYTEESVNF